MLKFPLFNNTNKKTSSSADRSTLTRSKSNNDEHANDDVFIAKLLEQWQDEDNSAAAAQHLHTSASKANTNFNLQSRLSASISAIANDPNCLSYFLQFMQFKNALPLIKFYLDIENFKNAARSQLRKASLHEAPPHEELAAQAPLQMQRNQETATSNEEKLQTETMLSAEAVVVDEDDDNDDDELNEEYEENNGVPELKTLCDLSMRKPLTDDEKSEIYAEANKHMTKCKLKAPHTERLPLESDNDSGIVDNAYRISAASIKDAIAIYEKYLITNASAGGAICLPVSILSQISLLLCRREQDDCLAAVGNSTISAECFDEAQQYVLQQMECEHLNDFLQSTLYCKYCVELIESEQLNIYDILYSEIALFFFMEFLEQQEERKYLDFWTAAINFRKSFITQKALDAEAQCDAMIIYEKFFSLQSNSRLWTSNKLRSSVEERICAAGMVPYCFDMPLQCTAVYLEKHFLHKFLKSQQFEQYFKELKTRILQDNSNNLKASISIAPNLRCHRKTMSDASSEKSREIFKQFSAADCAGMEGANMNIDARQLNQPNMLWQRSASFEGGLKFGRVDALGRYERDFDAHDSMTSSGGIAHKNNWPTLSRSGSRIKNAMRKLVNFPEHKVQEEIAWQVAEMIIRDVTSVTLKNVDGGQSVNGQQGNNQRGATLN